MRLHHALPVAGQKHNRYCGPAALAALTGLNTGEAAAMLRDITGKRAIMGTSSDAMIEALGRCGMRVQHEEEYYPHSSMTLRNWLRDFYKGQLILMIAMNHWWAMHDGFFVDSFNKLPTPIKDVHNPKSQVHKIYFLV